MAEKQKQRRIATALQDLALGQTQIPGRQDRIDANQRRIEKRIEHVLVNSSSIIAEQERIKDKQTYLDRILKTQGTIIENLKMSSISPEELARRAADQAATILSYQQVIISNQEKLDRILSSQAKFLLKQEQQVIPKAEKVLADNLTLLTSLQESVEEQSVRKTRPYFVDK